MDRSDRAALIALLSGGLLAGAAFVALSLWFAPGWSNGWPLHRNVVWPVGLSVVAFAAALVSAAGGGAAACEAAGGEARAWPPTGWYRAWVAASLLLSILASWAVYGWLRPHAVALWP